MLRHPNIVSVGIMSIIRLIETEKGNALTNGLWGAAQLNVGIVCACLPTLRPIVPKSTILTTSFRNLITSLRARSISSGFRRTNGKGGPNSDPVMNDRHDRYRNMINDGVDKAHLTGAIGGSDRFRPENDYPLNGIMVRRDIDIV